MNIITLHALHDLQNILNATPYLSGKAFAIDQEIEHNMWCINIDDVLLKSITEQDIVKFFDQLIRQRSQQIRDNYPKLSATLYVWFDRQALQLRFNIISGQIEELPFGCTVNRVNALNSIVHDFLKTAQSIAQHSDAIEIIEPGDGDWDDAKEDEYILDVFVTILNYKT